MPMSASNSVLPEVDNWFGVIGLGTSVFTLVLYLIRDQREVRGDLRTEVQQLHDEINRLRADNDRLGRDNMRLMRRIALLKDPE
jgi:hypothetical protein